MRYRVFAAALVIAAAGASYAADATRPQRHGTSPVTIAGEQRARTLHDIAMLEHQHLSWPEDQDLFMDAARTAWTFVNQHYQPETGFVMPLADYKFTTMWDIGGMLAALYSAHELGFIDRPEYDARVGKILTTLARLPLYDGRAFNKWYDAATGGRVDRGYERPDQFSGWSATDLGRLLVWLKIIGSDPRFEEKARAIVERIDMRHIVHDSYLWGEDLDNLGRQRVFQEGRIGYEQYAAHGFALWGYRAEKALDLSENLLPLSVMGQPLAADFRRWDRLTNEPFVLWGLEIGWDPPAASLVRHLLLAQEARYHKTGIITVVGEDAIPRPPHYFYYYCVYANGRQFAVDVADRTAVADGPRWVSAKSAFALHALLPNRYTDAAVRALGSARQRPGWASGVYEGTGQSTGGVSINTAAVILTAAVVNMRGEPILEQVRHAPSE
jgi:hypothetical protein